MDKETVTYDPTKLSEGSQYFEQNIRNVLSPDLQSIYLGLVNPLRKVTSLEFDGRHVGIKAPTPGSKYFAQAASLVNFGYNSMYLSNKKSFVDVAGGKESETGISLTLAAIDKFGDEEMVMGTHRLILGDRLEVFELFEMQKSHVWPHLQNGRYKKTAEFTKLAFHPLINTFMKSFSCNRLQPIFQYRREVLRKLWVFSFGSMNGLGVDIPYLVLAPHVHKFLKRCGLDVLEVPGIVPSSNQYAREIRNSFKEYWKPSSSMSEQPKVYLAPRIISDEQI